MLRFNLWTHPKTGQCRVYVDTRYDTQPDTRDANGSYFYEGENGELCRWFKPCPTGRYGRATHNVERVFNLEGLSFREFLDRIEAAKTPKGNFSETRYFKNLEQVSA